MHPLIYPMFALVVFSFAILILLVATRIKSVREGKTDARYFKTFNYTEPAEQVVKTTRQFTNLFETPVLFYTGSVAAMAMGVDSGNLTALAWIYVGLRVLHAIIHIGPNKIYWRMGAFAASCTVLMAFWVVLLCSGRP